MDKRQLLGVACIFFIIAFCIGLIGLALEQGWWDRIVDMHKKAKRETELARQQQEQEELLRRLTGVGLR